MVGPLLCNVIPHPFSVPWVPGGAAVVRCAHTPITQSPRPYAALLTNGGRCEAAESLRIGSGGGWVCVCLCVCVGGGRRPIPPFWRGKPHAHRPMLGFKKIKRRIRGGPQNALRPSRNDRGKKNPVGGKRPVRRRGGSNACYENTMQSAESSRGSVRNRFLG